MESVAEILGDEPHVDALPEPLEPPRHPTQPAFPKPGIYLGMPEEEYHSIHACSASGLKNLSVSSMDYWAHSLLNLEKQEADTRSDGKLTPMQLGQAYHCYICEGQIVFDQRYAVALDRDEIKEKCKQLGVPFCVTAADIRLAIDAEGGKAKGTAKDALIDQLYEFRPDAIVWEREVAAHEAHNQGKTMISPTLYRRIRIADAMIKNDPQIKDAFSGGYAEVSIFWYDQETGVPCKARIDYLKMNHLIDLKSFGNKQKKPIQRAIDLAIAYEKYFLAVAFYLHAIDAAKALVRKHKEVVVFRTIHDDHGRYILDHAPTKDQMQWLWQWAHQPEPDCLWIFQQTGVAPVTRGRIMNSGTTLELNRIAMRMLIRKWRKCAETYGVDPWLDIEPVRATVDEELGWAATDFGDINYEQ